MRLAGVGVIELSAARLPVIGGGGRAADILAGVLLGEG